MNRKLLGFVSVAVISFAGSQANAQVWGGYSRPSGYYDYEHSRNHDELAFRENQRYVEHAIAHQYPMLPYAHDRLHQSLVTERFVDEAQHRNSHRFYGSGFNGGGPFGGRCWGGSPYGNGLVIRGGRIQFYGGW